MPSSFEPAWQRKPNRPRYYPMAHRGPTTKAWPPEARAQPSWEHQAQASLQSTRPGDPPELRVALRRRPGDIFTLLSRRGIPASCGLSLTKGE